MLSFMCALAPARERTGNVPGRWTLRSRAATGCASAALSTHGHRRVRFQVHEHRAFAALTLELELPAHEASEQAAAGAAKRANFGRPNPPAIFTMALNGRLGWLVFAWHGSLARLIVHLNIIFK